jgi:diguanylate cyclase (GGDEF)-like protein/PAS domain S-box-containing protein
VRRIGPTLQITLGLVFLTNFLIVIADTVFNVLPDRTSQMMKVRKSVSEGMAVQVATLMQFGDRLALEQSLDALRQRSNEVRSIAVRRADQTLVAQAGDHEDAWSEPRNDRSTLTHVVVPLTFGTDRWGTFEMTYVPDPRNAFRRALTTPLWITILFVSLGGVLVYWLYMRRALQQLDPSAVIPERVRVAYDVMTEAVVLLDARGHILLANNAFRALHGDDGPDLTGKRLSTIRWLADDLPDDPHRHPWTQTMLHHVPAIGHAVEVVTAAGSSRKLVINCAPIADPGGSVRGCMVTMNDVTELHLSNERLRETLVELAVSRDELTQQNAKLERLATRDPLTGCLNRRAFFEQMEATLAESRRNGTPLSCLMVDIDRFKSVNDTYGHATGDRVIQEVAKKLVTASRTKDVICRYGGEEFCIGLPNADLAQASMVAERIRQAIEGQCGPAIREIPGFHVTASLGVATLDDTAGVVQAIEAADQALYRAKRGGRNRVCRAGESVEQDQETHATAMDTAAAESSAG